MKYAVLNIFLIALVVSAPLCSQESLTEPERPILMQMVRDLDHLTELVDSAERNRNKAIRFEFDYSELRADIDKVRGGILSHLEGPSRTARTLKPVSGDY